jgi:hypothetical protein
MPTLDRSQFGVGLRKFGGSSLLVWEEIEIIHTNSSKPKTQIFSNVTYGEKEIAMQFPTERSEFMTFMTEN